MLAVVVELKEYTEDLTVCLSSQTCSTLLIIPKCALFWTTLQIFQSILGSGYIIKPTPHIYVTTLNTYLMVIVTVLWYKAKQYQFKEE